MEGVIFTIIILTVYMKKRDNKGKCSQCLINHCVKEEYGECGYSCSRPPGVCCHFFLVCVVTSSSAVRGR
jgi:hypothetical protein